MRHRLRGRKLRRTTAHREAMLRNLVTSLLVHGRVITTPEKAKEGRRLAERLITLAKDPSLANHRRILSVVRDRKIARKVIDDLAKRFANRPGGYTRIVPLGGSRWEGKHHGWFAATRLGDGGRRAVWELVERKDREEEAAAAGRGKLAVDQEAKRRAEKKKAAAAASK